MTTAPATAPSTQHPRTASSLRSLKKMWEVAAGSVRYAAAAWSKYSCSAIGSGWMGTRAAAAGACAGVERQVRRLLPCVTYQRAADQQPAHLSRRQGRRQRRMAALTHWRAGARQAIQGRLVVF